MSKLITSEQLKKLIDPYYLSEDIKTLSFSGEEIKSYISEPKIIIDRNTIEQQINITALYIVPKKYVDKLPSKGYVVVRHEASITEMELYGRSSCNTTKEYLVAYCRYLQEEILSYFATYNFKSFKYIDVPNRLEVIDLMDLEKLDKVKHI